MKEKIFLLAIQFRSPQKCEMKPSTLMRTTIHFFPFLTDFSLGIYEYQVDTLCVYDSSTTAHSQLIAYRNFSKIDCFERLFARESNISYTHRHRHTDKYAHMHVCVIHIETAINRPTDRMQFAFFHARTNTHILRQQ